MKLYKTLDAKNVVNKKLDLIAEFPITIYGGIDVTRFTMPVTVPKGINILNCNYCYIDETERFYFIDGVKMVGNVAHLELSCDVLETYKQYILDTVGDYLAPIERGDYSQIFEAGDSRVEFENYNATGKFQIGKTIVMVTVGGK